MESNIIKIKDDLYAKMSKIEGLLTIYVSSDQENWDEFDYNHKEAVAILNAIAKYDFFTSHIGNKLQLKEGKIKGWLFIRGLDHITLIPENDKLLKVKYDDIEFVHISDSKYELVFNKFEEAPPIPVEEINRQKYVDNMEKSLKNHLPIEPLDVQYKK